MDEEFQLSLNQSFADQQRLQREQEEQLQRQKEALELAQQKAPELNETVKNAFDQSEFTHNLNQLSPEQKEAVFEGLAVDVAFKSGHNDHPNIKLMYYDPQTGCLMANIGNNKYAFVNVEETINGKGLTVDPELLEAKNPDKTEYQKAKSEPYSELYQRAYPPVGRKKQIIDALDEHLFDKQVSGFNKKEQYILKEAVGFIVHDHAGDPPKVHQLQINKDEVQLQLGERSEHLSLPTQKILAGESLENIVKQSIEPSLEPEDTRRKIIAQQGDTGWSLAKKLDSEHPYEALGALYRSGQIRDIQLKDGHQHVIPNIQPNKEYTYDRSQYTEAEQAINEKIGRKNTSGQGMINARIDQARAEQARQIQEERQLTAQHRNEQISLAKGGMSEDPYYQQLRKEQKFDPLSYARQYKAKDDEIVLGMLGNVNLNKLPIPDTVKHWGVEVYQATEQRVLNQKAAFETGLNMLTGMGSRMAAGVTSIPAAAIYGTEAAVAIQKDIQERYTYTPSASTQEIIQKNIGQPLAPYIKQMEQGIESVRQSNVDAYGLAGTALLFGSFEVLSEVIPVKGGKQLAKVFKMGGDDTITAITKNAIKEGNISNVKYFEHGGVSFNKKHTQPTSNFSQTPVIQKNVTVPLFVEKHAPLIKEPTGQFTGTKADPNFEFRTNVENTVLPRASKEITYPTEVPSPLSYKETQFAQDLKTVGLTAEEFRNLNLKSVDTWTDLEVQKMKQLREMVPNITTETELQKVISFSDIDRYLDPENPYTTIGGYIARAEDVKHLKNYDEVYESLRLDYPNTKFAEDGTSYGIIRFKMEKVEKIQIPYGSKLGGTDTSSAPATRNGFLATRNGDAIPEWNYPKGVYELPRDGAELYKVVNGKEVLAATFSGSKGRFIPE
ncbi:hypothetical protein [Neisseria sp. Ec49-e6-T10]|uniref:hypothetical protein n=1 Tax=Neisseria sp. Ec49-e6-T10 TaxID=3140744 RepID=UPI003EBBB1E8